MTEEEEIFDGEENENIIYGSGEEEEEEADTFIPSLDSDSDDEISYNPKRNNYHDIINKFKMFVPDIPISECSNDLLHFHIPTTLLPVTLSVAYGFIDCDILLDFVLGLDDYNWRKRPIAFEITNPVTRNYCGKALVERTKENFFTPEFKPKTNYRSAPLILRAQKNANPDVVKQVENSGYTHMQAVRAVSLCDNDYDKSITFLQTGQYSQEEPFQLLLSYVECPLLFYVLEVLNSILDLQDHCAMCGEPTSPGLKPSVCTKELCVHRFVQLGVGNSVVKEIARDPFVADLLFSVFACAYNTKYFNPKPDMPKKKTLEEIINKMPPMQKIKDCLNDSYLLQMIGSDAIDILRWVILTCRSNFLLLPNQLEFNQFRATKSDSKCYQFMAITASPEQEIIFQQLKKQYGSRFLWHGSPTERWHSIIRQGLKNMTGTSYMQSGAAHGPGIYFAPDSSTSLGYSQTFKNLYPNSKLGENLQVIALCEVINLPLGVTMNITVDVHGRKKNLTGFLKDHGWCLTLTMDEACIVRFLFVNLDRGVNVAQNPPTKIPNLIQVLKMRANIK